MNYVMLFEQFLNEINLASHIVDERASLTSNKSRIRMRSKKFPDGWDCKMLINLNNGTKVPMNDFLASKNLKMNGVEYEISGGLKKLLTEGEIKKKNYKADTREYKAAYLGKIVLDAMGEKYSPMLEFSTRAGEKAGNNIWVLIDDYNTGKTVVFHEDFVKDSDLLDQGYRDYMWRASSGQAGYHKVSLETFRNMFFIDRKFLAMDLVIPITGEQPPVKNKEVETVAKEEPRMIQQIPGETNPDYKYKSVTLGDKAQVGYYVNKNGVQTLIVRNVISSKSVTLEELRSIAPNLIEPRMKGETRKGAYMELAGAEGKVAKILAKFPGDSMIVGSGDGKFYNIKLDRISKKADSTTAIAEGYPDKVFLAEAAPDGSFQITEEL
jgi:hypothetical protein